MGEGNGHNYQLCLGCGDTGEQTIEQAGGIKVVVPCYFCTEEDAPEDEYPAEEEDVDVEF